MPPASGPRGVRPCPGDARPVGLVPEGPDEPGAGDGVAGEGTLGDAGDAGDAGGAGPDGRGHGAVGADQAARCPWRGSDVRGVSAARNPAHAGVGRSRPTSRVTRRTNGRARSGRGAVRFTSPRLHRALVVDVEPCRGDPAAGGTTTHHHGVCAEAEPGPRRSARECPVRELCGTIRQSKGSSMRQFTAVVNPTAGGATSAAALPGVARLLREAGAGLETEYSDSLAHARELAVRAGERGRVVLAVGGDGIAGGIGGALSGTGTVLGLVPAGRGNDFARALNLPTEPAALARVLLDGEPRAVDTLEVTSAVHDRTVVLGSVYAGVDALANHHANHARLLRGRASYYAGALRAVAGWRATRYRVTVDGEEHAFTGYTTVAANSGYYGSDRRIAPGAKVDDGLLEVVMIHEVSRLLFFAIMNELGSGAHVRRPQVRVLRGREVRIEADRPVPYGADGEVEAALPVTARILPGALRVLA